MKFSIIALSGLSALAAAQSSTTAAVLDPQQACAAKCESRNAIAAALQENNILIAMGSSIQARVAISAAQRSASMCPVRTTPWPTTPPLARPNASRVTALQRRPRHTPNASSRASPLSSSPRRSLPLARRRLEELRLSPSLAPKPRTHPVRTLF